MLLNAVEAAVPVTVLDVVPENVTPKPAFVKVPLLIKFPLMVIALLKVTVPVIARLLNVVYPAALGNVRTD